MIGISLLYSIVDLIQFVNFFIEFFIETVNCIINIFILISKLIPNSEYKIVYFWTTVSVLLIVMTWLMPQLVLLLKTHGDAAYKYRKILKKYLDDPAQHSNKSTIKGAIQQQEEVFKYYEVLMNKIIGYLHKVIGCILGVSIINILFLIFLGSDSDLNKFNSTLNMINLFVLFFSILLPIRATLTFGKFINKDTVQPIKGFFKVMIDIVNVEKY